MAKDHGMGPSTTNGFAVGDRVVVDSGWLDLPDPSVGNVVGIANDRLLEVRFDHDGTTRRTECCYVRRRYSALEQLAEQAE